MTALVLSSSTFFGPLSNKSLEVVGSTSVGILWILYPFEEGIGGSKILSLDGHSMLSRNNFREGLCWSDINTTFLKCRKKQCSVNDVKSMSLYGVSAIVPEDYIITLLNSTFFSYYVDTFVNNTQTFQINDARQLPVIVPTLDTIEITHILLRRAVAIMQQAGPHEDSLLEKLQKEVDTLVLKIYGLTP